MGKTDFGLGESKGADQLFSTFVFASQIEQFLFFLNLKFQVYIHLLLLHRAACVKPSRKLQDSILAQMPLSYEPPRKKTNNVVSEQV